MQKTRTLWRWLAVVFFLSFAALGWIGREIYLDKPPIPQQVVSSGGQVLYTGAQIQRGQEAWLSAGGQQMGSVWGHGSYVAPDWSADWLHREAVVLRNIWAQQQFKKDYEQLNREEQAPLDVRLVSVMRSNTYDKASDTITIQADRAVAMQQVAQHYVSLFGSDPAKDQLREQYAMISGSIKNADDFEVLS